MRISCSFNTDKIPIHYRMAMVSIIKEALRTSDEAYYHRLYQKGQHMKPFSFSTYLKNFRLFSHEIKLDGITLTVSSPDHEFLLHLYNGLQKNRAFSYKDYHFVKKKIAVVNEKQVTSPSVVFRTLSPILIEDEKGNPVAPDDESYAEHVNYIANMILSQYRGTGLYVSLSIKPVYFKKVVVKESNHEFAAACGDDEYLYFTAYHGLFAVTGHPEDLQLLYQLGLSKRRNQGFGQLEIEEVRG
ncbi:CRISPR-associated endoribonuclease Cas6 [Parageobacillus thermoglucosidasius]|uniref:CRISPR-associated endoribonuclease Cas6 n=1 Tax=Parageobacillus thermoglucosidasius TaxID=1426 RepID=UPI000E1766FE|nr:CRISPR-associated endoribonuclease Cas6 [Parageobacillus thermoglucosidasius]RDE31500.1 CRISPR-associated endoribonuclease Cas6 [Parageobacillus thermoglucosidasius]GCD82217.1 CRISPR-associated endoribonuclease Cas6 [Parageobacillus thermoglucosidasius]